MSRYPTIRRCIDELKAILLSLDEKTGNGLAIEGYNCAVSCAKDSIQTRIDTLEESFTEYDVDEVIDERSECICEIESAIYVLQSDCDDSSEQNEFNIAFSSKLNDCIQKLQNVLSKFY